MAEDIAALKVLFNKHTNNVGGPGRCFPSNPGVMLVDDPEEFRVATEEEAKRALDWFKKLKLYIEGPPKPCCCRNGPNWGGMHDDPNCEFNTRL